MDHKASDGRGLVVRQIPAHRPIELSNGRRAVDHNRPVALFANAQHSDVVLITNIANDLLDDVFKRDQSLHDAVFVDDERRMGLSAQEHLQLVAQRRRIRG